MQKLTTKQKKILSVLEKHEGALSAAQIHTELPAVDLATVYRALDKLHEINLIKKLVLDGTKALYEHMQDSHHHAVCADCEEVIHFHIDETKLQNIVSVPNFEATDIEIIVRGKHNK